jgi:hypothetical protein
LHTRELLPNGQKMCLVYLMLEARARVRCFGFDLA